MQEKFFLRDFCDEDYKFLKQIVIDTWFNEDFDKQEIVNEFAEVYLSSYFTNRTFAKVAIVDNTPVGIIMGKNLKIHKYSLKFYLKKFYFTFLLYKNKKGREALRVFNDINKIDMELLKKSKHHYTGEAILFIVNSKYRGYGIGRKLFESLLNYMKNEKVDKFYLFTDTYCNYHFYEQYGMKCCCEKGYSFNGKNEREDITFFLYES